MGNRSSTGSLSSTLTRLRSRPTREDYKAYVDDLLELQKFLNKKFVAGHLRGSVVDDDFDAEYLDALKIKLRQLQNVRRHVKSRRGRSANDVPPALMTLLDALEPQCQKAVDELTRLQSLHTSTMSTTSSQGQPAVLSDTAANDEDSSSSTTSDGECVLLLNDRPGNLYPKQPLNATNACELQMLHRPLRALVLTLYLLTYSHTHLITHVLIK